MIAQRHDGYCMKILGIETATPLCAAALIDGTRTLDQQSVEAPHVHAERLLVLIDEILMGTSVPAAGLDAIAVSTGPGSYTGLRVGLSVAKGIAFAVDVPIVAVPTLHAIAVHAQHGMDTAGRTIVAILESRRDEVFLAVYATGSEFPMEVRPPAAMSTGEAATLIRSLAPVCIAGPGIMRVVPMLQSEIGSGNVLVPPKEMASCSAVPVALLGAHLFEQNGGADLASLEPFYLKEFFTTANPVQTTN